MSVTDQMALEREGVESDRKLRGAARANIVATVDQWFDDHPDTPLFRKVAGAYAGSYWSVEGRVRIGRSEWVLAAAVGIPGLLHIFDPAQLEPVV